MPKGRMMDLKAFENLELIPKLLQKIESMEERMTRLAPSITTKKEVARILGVTTRTVNNYIASGELRHGKHFFRKNGKILVFVEEAILEYRNKRCKTGA